MKEKIREFKINNYLTIKLESGKTNIYVKNRLFKQCKYLLLSINVHQVKDLDNIDIDKEAEMLYQSMEKKNIEDLKLSPETEFWGHCSNLQVWAENNYNSRLLHRTIAFPLLKRLVEIGDLTAGKIFKEEIADRFIKGNFQVRNYLISEGYLENLDMNELIFVLKDSLSKKELLIFLEKLISNSPDIATYLINKIGRASYDLMKNQIIGLVKRLNNYNFYYLASEGFLKELNNIELMEVFERKAIQDLFELFLKINPSYLNLGLHNLLKLIKKISSNYFKMTVIRLYKSGILKIYEFLDKNNLSKFISRDEYFQYLLNRKEAKIMSSFEKSLNIHFRVVSNLKCVDIKAEIEIKNKKIIGISLGAEPEYKIKNFPNLVLKLKNLKKLYIMGFNFKTIPHKICKLKRLQELDLSDNNLLSIPTCISKLESLKLVNLKFNPITSID